MGQSCKGICERYKANTVLNGLRYKLGQKRCSYCEIFIEWKGFRCPCCGTILRLGTRSAAGKKRNNNVKKL